MLLLAHRGYHADFPENTLPAFEAAVALGADGIETDVRLSADGLPVLFHDERIHGGRRISQLTRSELEQAVGHPVPTLDQALERWPDLLWNVEVKEGEALPRVIQVLRAYRRISRLLVTSFEREVVIAAAAALKVQCGLLLPSRPRSLRARLARYRRERHVRTLVWNYRALAPSALEAARSLGWSNYAYGAVTKAEHERCLRLEIEGLITDYPHCLLEPKNSGGPAG